MAHEHVHSWRESLVSKLLLRFWVSLFIFFALIGFIQYQTLKYFLYKSEEQTQVSEITSLQAQSERWLKGQESYPQSLPDLNQGEFLAYFSPDRQLQAVIARREIKNKNQALRVLSPQWKEGKKLPSRLIVETASKERYLLILRPVSPSTSTSTPSNSTKSSLTTASSSSANPLGYVLIASPLTKADSILNQDLKIYFSNALAVFTLGGLAAAYLLRRPLRPLTRISEISAKIAEGEYTLRIPQEPAASEIVQLRSTLNTMLSRMETALATEKRAKEQMARFIADASHELRTPLTSIRGFLEILQRNKKPDPETLQAAHQTMLTETERLIQLVEDLLTLNRLSQTSPGSTSFTLSTSIQEILPDVLPLIDSIKGERTLLIEGALETALPLEPGELKQILYNLVHNAIRHTSADQGIIQLDVQREASKIILSVADNGEGIAPNDQPHLFERFYRGNRSRERKKGQGAGLGLAIISDIVQLRHGEIEVASELGKGTTFKITWC